MVIDHFLSFVDARRLVKCLRSATGVFFRLSYPSRDKTRKQGARSNRRHNTLEGDVIRRNEIIIEQ